MSLVHNTLEVARHRLEVWSDDPREVGEARGIILYVDRNAATTEYVDLTPAEARALAALLVVAAERQERTQ